MLTLRIILNIYYKKVNEIRYYLFNFYVILFHNNL